VVTRSIEKGKTVGRPPVNDEIVEDLRQRMEQNSKKSCNLPEGMVHYLGISRRAIFVLGGSFSTKIGRHGFG
jgi:hypothetical protein